MSTNAKEAVRAFENEFIPKGKPVDISNLRFRKTTDDEILRCCVRMGEDLQSGPYFCGHLAEWVAATMENGKVTGHVAMCGRGRHKPPKENIIQE